MSQSEQKGVDQLTWLCNMYLGGNLGKCLIFRLPSRAVNIIIIPRFGSFHLEPIFTGAHLLAPCKFHAAHKLTSGMLLEVEVMEGPLHNHRGGVCNKCMHHLSSGTTPPLSLANAMWIGKILNELGILSLLERIPVARYLPAIFIVKLFPTKKGTLAYGWDE